MNAKEAIIITRNAHKKLSFIAQELYNSIQYKIEEAAKTGMDHISISDKFPNYNHKVKKLVIRRLTKEDGFIVNYRIEQKDGEIFTIEWRE